jgi:hypothetical protein
MKNIKKVIMKKQHKPDRTFKDMRAFLAEEQIVDRLTFQRRGFPEDTPERSKRKIRKLRPDYFRPEARKPETNEELEKRMKREHPDWFLPLSKWHPEINI